MVALSLLGVPGLGVGRAAAQCNSFTVIQQTGTIVPGDTDIGNHTDDAPTTPISLPFSWSLYGSSYNSVNACSNGNLQFTTTSTAYTNACLQVAAQGAMIAPHWDDLRTDG